MRGPEGCVGAEVDRAQTRRKRDKQNGDNCAGFNSAFDIKGDLVLRKRQVLI